MPLYLVYSLKNGRKRKSRCINSCLPLSNGDIKVTFAQPFHLLDNVTRDMIDLPDMTLSNSLADLVNVIFTSPISMVPISKTSKLSNVSFLALSVFWDTCRLNHDRSQEYVGKSISPQSIAIIFLLFAISNKNEAYFLFQSYTSYIF